MSSTSSLSLDFRSEPVLTFINVKESEGTTRRIFLKIQLIIKSRVQMYDIASLSDGFIPSSANSYAPGKLSAEGSQWNLKLKSQVEGEDDILFKSAKTEAKELDCLLVYHPDTQV